MKNRFLNIVLVILGGLSFATQGSASTGNYKAKGEVAFQLSYFDSHFNPLALLFRLPIAIGTLGVAYALPDSSMPVGLGYKYIHTVEETHDITTDLTLEVQPYGEGRAIVLLEGEELGDCQGFQQQMVGLESAQGAYDLRAYEVDVEGILRVGEASLGSLVSGGSRVFVNFAQGMDFATVGDEGTCKWISPPGSHFALERVSN